MRFVDTHCHIHAADTQLVGEQHTLEKWQKGGVDDPDQVLKEAAASGVDRIICVGTTLEDSQAAISFSANRQGAWASIGLHPHEAKAYSGKTDAAEVFSDMISKPKVVAVGECGLDYYYNHSPKADQESILRYQIELALGHKLPLIFHVRDAFDDFWPILDEYKGIRGVIHSFSSNTRDLDNILSRGLYVGLNGIMTFTKSQEQLEAAKNIPLDKLLLETDAPFLTPAPFRGKVCEPKYVRVTAEFLGKLRGETLELIADSTTQNAKSLFGLG